MVKVRAWERLNDPDYSGSLTMVEFHDLLLQAGIDADTARRAASERGWKRLSAGEVM